MEQNEVLQDEVVESIPEDEKEFVEAMGEGMQLLEKILQIETQVANLQKCFDNKIVTDQHKNQLFDTMHSELVDYRNGSVDKLINSISVDIIQVIDSILKNYAIYQEREKSEENYDKLLKNYHNITDELQDILYRQSIEPYQNEGEAVDVKKQKIIGTVPTEDEQQNNLICRRVGAGYEKNGKVIRPERILIYKYTSNENE